MEFFEEIRLKYKIMEPWKRLFIAGIVGLLLPFVWVYLESDLAIIQAAKDEAMAKKEQTEVRLNKLIAQKKNAPRLEEQLSFTKEQLVEARRNLPDNYFMDQILSKVGMSALRAKVELLTFTPQKENVVGDEERYMELPLALKVRGGYGQIGQFVDNLVHFENMVHVRNIEIKDTQDKNAQNAAAKDLAGTMSRSLAARLADEFKEKKLEATMELVVFRSLKPGESISNSGNQALGAAPIRENAAEKKTNHPPPPSVAPADGKGDLSE